MYDIVSLNQQARPYDTSLRRMINCNILKDIITKKCFPLRELAIHKGKKTFLFKIIFSIYYCYPNAKI